MGQSRKRVRKHLRLSVRLFLFSSPFYVCLIDSGCGIANLGSSVYIRSRSLYHPISSSFHRSSRVILITSIYLTPLIPLVPFLNWIVTSSRLSVFRHRPISSSTLPLPFFALTLFLHRKKYLTYR